MLHSSLQRRPTRNLYSLCFIPDHSGLAEHARPALAVGEGWADQGLLLDLSFFLSFLPAALQVHIYLAVGTGTYLGRVTYLLIREVGVGWSGPCLPDQQVGREWGKSLPDWSQAGHEMSPLPAWQGWQV